MCIREPLFNSGTPFNYAPLLTAMLTKIKDLSGSKTICDIPFVAVVAASLAHRCRGLNISIEKLRSSVQTQILSTETILQHRAKICKDDNTIPEMLSRIKTVKKWATNCHDVVSFGHMMSWLKVQHVLCIRLFIHDSSLLQLFAYMCEGKRLRGEPLPTALEVLFDDQRISGFLFFDGRPKTLEDCNWGVQRWSDPNGMLKNLKLTQHIFSKRCKPTVAQRIFEGHRMTHKMVKQLNGQSLEDCLNCELNPPDPFRLEAILISAVCSVSKKDLTKEKAWFHLRTKVFQRPILETKLLSGFMEKYDQSGHQTDVTDTVNDSTIGGAIGKPHGSGKDETGCPAPGGSRDHLATQEDNPHAGGLYYAQEEASARRSLLEHAGTDEGWEYITEEDILEYCLSS
jgi:hypothetical protein